MSSLLRDYHWPAYGVGGFSRLDFFLVWMMQAIHRRDAEDAERWATTLTHYTSRIYLGDPQGAP